jgi:hypothetical protein
LIRSDIFRSVTAINSTAPEIILQVIDSARVVTAAAHVADAACVVAR